MAKILARESMTSAEMKELYKKVFVPLQMSEVMEYNGPDERKLTFQSIKLMRPRPPSQEPESTY